MIVQKISPCHFQLFPKAFSIQFDQRFDSILEKRCKCSVRWWPPHPRADLRGILGSLRGCTEAPSAGQQPPPQIGWTGHWSVHTLLFCYFFPSSDFHLKSYPKRLHPRYEPFYCEFFPPIDCRSGLQRGRVLDGGRVRSYNSLSGQQQSSRAAAMMAAEHATCCCSQRTFGG